MDAIREIVKPWLGDPKWKITQRSAKLVYKYTAVGNLPAQLKIEINTTEHFQVLPSKIYSFKIPSGWFEGSADIATYDVDEWMATKLRALYQRRKGRDLFDLWFVVTNKLVDLGKMIEIFTAYCDHNGVKISGGEFMKNLEEKRNHRDFASDMNILLPSKHNWHFEEAYRFVKENVIALIP